MNSKTVITISREYGSGGLEIGRSLAEALNVPFYDSEIIAQESEKEQILTERNCEWLIDNGLRSGGLAGAAFAFGPAFGNVSSQLFLKEANVIWKLAKGASCVIVGRCADFVLQNRPHTYRVFLSSAMPQRIRQIHERPALYDKAAKKEAHEILHMDKRRAAYYSYYTGLVWGKASNYDLCIDTGVLGPQTVDVILDFIRRAEQQKKQE